MSLSPPESTDAVRLCRGLAHELSNVLCYLLPAASEIAGWQHGGPRAMSAEDLERLARQLQLGGHRLEQLFSDLRLGFARPDRLEEVDLRAALRAAAEAVESAPVPVRLALGEGPPVLVQADPQLLGTALGRFLRAAVAWADTAGAAVSVTLRESRARTGDQGTRPPAGPAPQGARNRARGWACIEALIVKQGEEGSPLPPPQGLLDMLCPSESSTVRAERGPLGVLVGAHLLRVHGGELFARQGSGGVALCAELPLCRGRESR